MTAIESAVVRIIDQWHELICNFDISRLNEKCFTAEMLYNMYLDERNLAFLLFLIPLLGDLQRVNELFESNSVYQTKLVSELVILICWQILI
jgi:hypothetical protein